MQKIERLICVEAVVDYMRFKAQCEIDNLDVVDVVTAIRALPIEV